ncbi:hypothetical protein [Mycolicibacterium sp. P9-22]|uniref:hypothetical protein n=1 Tax=Mycolicibacterium sp. P9-22 TaxID=2024613 RepID=UPI0011EF80E8|nr:hypothetical protein [Mycolicibacterium sp. P9-22]KAA0118384.1 hypothetical protein CIW51_07790 [Mycolicibacterium sp. P9-22]
MNKPASLTAGVCSLCITATMVAIPPHAAAADLPVIQHRSVSVSDQPYELTATSVALQNLLLVAGIPFNNLNTTLTTLGGLTNFVTGLNQALGNIYKGNWDLVPANLQKAWTDEVAAFQKVLQLPQTLITYNTKTIQNFVNSLAAGGSTLAVQSAASTAAALPTAQSDVTNALLVVLGIPFNNLNTTLSTLGGLTNFVTGLNQALGNIYKGNWDLVPANLQKAWTDEVAAFQKVLQLPQTLITYNVRALQNLFGSPAPISVTSTFVTSERVHTLALPSAAPAIESSTPESADELTVIGVKGATTAADGAKSTVTEHDKVTGSPETVDKVDSTVPAEDTTVETPTEAAPEESGEPPAEKSAPTDTDQAADAGNPAEADTSDAGATYGKHALKSGTSGKHARPDDATDSTASSSTDGSSTDSAPGRHRKGESTSEGSSSASSSTGGSSAAA